MSLPESLPRQEAVRVYGRALCDGEPLRARTFDGAVFDVPVDRYLGGVPQVERALLDRARGPVLDIGCGPGRHVIALAQRGAFAVGIDIAPDAVRLARGRGAAVVHGCVFDRVPGHGSWGTALLLDGNVGIGGDPVALLRRSRDLLRPGGGVLVELDSPGCASASLLVRLERGAHVSGWLKWSRLAAGDIHATAATAGLCTREVWEGDGRWFAELRAS